MVFKCTKTPSVPQPFSSSCIVYLFHVHVNVQSMDAARVVPPDTQHSRPALALKMKISLGFPPLISDSLFQVSLWLLGCSCIVYSPRPPHPNQMVVKRLRAAQKDFQHAIDLNKPLADSLVVNQPALKPDDPLIRRFFVPFPPG